MSDLDTPAPTPDAERVEKPLCVCGARRGDGWLKCGASYSVDASAGPDAEQALANWADYLHRWMDATNEDCMTGYWAQCEQYARQNLRRFPSIEWHSVRGCGGDWTQLLDRDQLPREGRSACAVLLVRPAGRGAGAGGGAVGDTDAGMPGEKGGGDVGPDGDSG